jgi:hypothetical protein
MFTASASQVGGAARDSLSQRSADLAPFEEKGALITMFRQHSATMWFVAGFMAILPLSASANYLTSATATWNCQGYNLTVDATDLTKGTPYTIDYSFTLTCNNSPATVLGSINFTATGSTASNTTDGFLSLLSGNCTLTGSATLTSSGSTVPITVTPSSVSCPGPSLACTSTNTGTVGVPFNSAAITVTGGIPPYTFTATGLPPGLTISPSGTISGTPTVSGSFTYTVTVTDSAGNKGTSSCSITVQPGGSRCKIGPSSMEGSLTNIHPGDWISGGYDFTIPGSHAGRTVTVTNPTVTLPVYCPQGGGLGGNIVISLPSATYPVSANNNNWTPTGDQNSVLSWEGSVQAPDLCGGKPMANQSGAIYNASTNTQGGANFRFKYRDPNAKGGTKGNVDCADPNWVPISDRNNAATCGASWSQTVTCQ